MVFDIFLYVKYDGKRLEKMHKDHVYFTRETANLWPKCGLRDLDQIKPEKCEFWGEVTTCPVDWKTILTECYGDDVMTVAYK